jgi:hypothetical protein
LAVWAQPLPGSWASAVTPQALRTDFPVLFIALQAWHPNPVTGWPTLLRHPFAQASLRGTGILTRCPSPTACALGLGPTNPTRINLASETSDLRRTCFSHVSRYSCQHSLFWTLHHASRHRFDASRTLPYHPDLSITVRGFGDRLSPVILSAQDH